MITKICKNCGKEFSVFPAFRNRLFCCRKCYWNNGYHRLFMKTHPNNGQFKKGEKHTDNWTKAMENRKGIAPNINWTQEIKIKQSIGIKLAWKNKDWSERNKKVSLALKGKPKSDEHNRNVSKAQIKRYDKIGRIKHRRSYHNTDRKYVIWRTKIFKRDNYTCQICGLKGGKLQVHHIKSWSKYPALRYKLNNGISVCIPCHKQTNNYSRKDSSL